MVLEEGFAWNGKNFGSLSQIAKAMTGTNWNGHRFFGLRHTKGTEVGGKSAGGKRRRGPGGSSGSIGEVAASRPTKGGAGIILLGRWSFLLGAPYARCCEPNAGFFSEILVSHQPARTASRETEFCARRLWAKRAAHWARRPSNRPGRLNLAPPTCGTVEDFQTFGHLASPGRLAGGGRSRRETSLWRLNFLLTGKITGNFSIFACFGENWRRKRTQFQRVTSKFPMNRNRGLIRRNREFQNNEQGIL
jgi:hypothetical protein